MDSRILYLLRHAEALPAEGGLTDYDRPLSTHGEDQAEAVAHYLRDRNITFDYVMCSSSLRTMETLEPLKPYLGTAAIDLNPQYYNASDDKILSFLQLSHQAHQRVLYIGHNPGIALTALRLISQDAPHPYIKTGFSRGTLAGFSFDIKSWDDLSWGQGTLIDFYDPDQPL